MDAGDRARSDVVGKVAEHHTVHQRRAEVLGEDHLQPALDVLREEEETFI